MEKLSEYLAEYIVKKKRLFVKSWGKCIFEAQE